MRLEITVVGRTIIASEWEGVSPTENKILAAGSPREVAEALKMRFKMLLNGKA